LVVVASDVSGAAYELVEDRRSGRIFPVGNLEQLKEALLDVTDDNALPKYKQESRAALARWRNETDPVAEIRRALKDARVPLPVRAGLGEGSLAATVR
jgi:glycosyltransferase involved in cell wall biosynthesis